MLSVFEKDGYLLLSIKARSVILQQAEGDLQRRGKKLEQAFEPGFEVLTARELMPYHEDHLECGQIKEINPLKSHF